MNVMRGHVRDFKIDVEVLNTTVAIQKKNEIADIYRSLIFGETKEDKQVIAIGAKAI